MARVYLHDGKIVRDTGDVTAYDLDRGWAIIPAVGGSVDVDLLLRPHNSIQIRLNGRGNQPLTTENGRALAHLILARCDEIDEARG